MVGGLKNTSSRLAIATAASLFAGGLALTPAQAADLGGDCCADLEERVAELEATAVRHGNRKVKLKLSGQVNTAVMYWDDGVESDVYVIDSDESSSRIRLDANGTIRPGLTAGLVIEFDVEVANGGLVSAANDDHAGLAAASGGGRVQLRRANWFIKGSFGKISVGQGSQASDGAFEVSFANTWVGSVGYGLGVTNNGGFQVRNIAAAIGATLSWFAVGTDNDTGRDNRVRYDSPTFAGFTVSASWGEDDEYDIALRYAKEFNGLKVAAAAAYNNEDGGNPAELGGVGELDRWGVSAAVLHTPSGVHFQGGYSNLDVQGAGGPTTFERTHYWVAAGIQFRASDLGTTDIAIDYIDNENETVGVRTVDYDSFGIGLAQDIDAVGGTLYLSYRHHEADISADVVAANVGVGDDFDQIQFGMRLRY